MFRSKSSVVKSTQKPGNKAVTPRSKSLPLRPRRKARGVMTFVSADDSLSSKYGEKKKEKDKPKMNIVWSNIYIREYARTIGDNPSCSSGPPVSISWEFNEKTPLSVDKYEDTRPPRRSNIEMILPRDLRQRMLKKDWDVTQSQIASAVRTNIKIKNQRRTTVNNLGKSTKMEEAMESAGKGLMAGMFGRNTDKKVKKLEEQMKLADAARKQMMLEDTDDDLDGSPEDHEDAGQTDDTMEIDVE